MCKEITKDQKKKFIAFLSLCANAIYSQYSLEGTGHNILSCALVELDNRSVFLYCGVEKTIQ